MEKNQDPLLISYLTLRKAIGILGILLPVILLSGNFLIGKSNQIQASISAYYFTQVGDLFVGILCALSIFLFTYKGYDKKDHLLSNLAGLFALGVAFFPTSKSSPLEDIKFTELHIINIDFSIWHYLAAALFFLTLSGISLFLFTKSSGVKTEEKKLRNKIYRTCGILMVVSIVLIGLYHITDPAILEPYKPVFWLEWLALIAFGTSWLIKGEALINDK